MKKIWTSLARKQGILIAAAFSAMFVAAGALFAAMLLANSSRNDISNLVMEPSAGDGSSGASAGAEPPTSSSAEPSPSASADESPSDFPVAEKFLSDLDPVKSAFAMPVKVNGRTYPDSVVLGPNSNAEEAEYDLSREWRALRATVGIRDDAPANAKVRFEVLGDGHRLYRKELGFGQSDTIKVDVTGVLRLKIKATALVNDDAYYVAFGDALLKR